MLQTLNNLLDRSVNLQPRWVSLLLLIPCLYLIGWLLAQVLNPFGLSANDLSLIGTLLSFLLFLVLMPRWIRIRWHERHPWRVLGLTGGPHPGHPSAWIALSKGLLWATLLLSLIVTPILIGSWGIWLGETSIDRCLNAGLLTVGVGTAEELIFRGWLLEELNRLIGSRRAVLGQALVFSLVHTRFNLGVASMLSLLIGLFLLGMALAARRLLDQGCLWGSIGLHGGLVGGWFLLQGGLLQLSPDVPAWLAGPGGLHPNPLGSLVAILALLLLLGRQLTAVASAARPVTGARKA